MSAATSKRTRAAATVQRQESPPGGDTRTQSDGITTSAAGAGAGGGPPPGESEPFTSPDFDQEELLPSRDTPTSLPPDEVSVQRPTLTPIIIAPCCDKNKFTLHDPYKPILFREFTNSLVALGYQIFHADHRCPMPVLAWCVSQIFNNNILKYACSVQGFLYTDNRKTLVIMEHMAEAYKVYLSICKPRQKEPFEGMMKMRELLWILKDVEMINVDMSAKAIVDILGRDDPKVNPHDVVDLELEMTFLEFFEALVKLADVYVTEAVLKDPATPRPSSGVTGQSQSYAASATGGGGAGGGGGGGQAGQSRPPSQPMPTKSGRNTPVDHSQTASDQMDTMKKPNATPDNKNKVNSSFGSSRSGMDYAGCNQNVNSQSMVSFNGPEADLQLNRRLTNPAEDTFAFPEQELDEETRRYNFWGHQIQIFFVRKFFPSISKFNAIKKSIQENKERQLLNNRFSESPRQPLTNNGATTTAAAAAGATTAPLTAGSSSSATIAAGVPGCANGVPGDAATQAAESGNGLPPAETPDQLAELVNNQSSQPV